MISILTINQAVAARSNWTKQDVIIVPTMGNLHQAHLELVRYAKSLGGVVIVSIYVNPLQFSSDKEYASYPRTLSNDCMLLADEGVDAVFCPKLLIDDVNHHTNVNLPSDYNMHCNKCNADFFSGVATIVVKLFNILRPNIAVFGEKDYEQLLCIKKIVSDLNYSVKIHSMPTVRLPNGLAYSSRNNNLTNEQQVVANKLYQQLITTKNAIVAKNCEFSILMNDAVAVLTSYGFDPQHYSICNANTLKPADKTTKEFVVLAAAYLGQTRLIDNVKFCLDK